MPEIQVLVQDVVSKLKKREIEGSQTTARVTAELLRSVISQQREPPINAAAVALIEAVRRVGEQLIDANPAELAVGNIVRRVLHIIREEDCSLVTNAVGGLKLSAEADAEVITGGENNQNLSVAAIPAICLSQSPALVAILDRFTYSATACQPSALGDGSEGKGKSADKNARNWKLKHDVIRAVNELIEDLDTCHEQIAEQAVELIHHNEVILTFGYSRFVMEFLCAAKAKNRSLDVIIAEGTPKYQGHDLAKKLSQRGLNTTVITDSAVFAMISRVNMVIVAVHAVMANGGIIVPIGLKMVALAAQKHAVPLVVVAGIHELCPLNPHNTEVVLNELRSPYELFHIEKFSDCMDYGISGGSPLLHVVNPAFDYVPPELVSLFVTDVGGYNPSFIYQLIADYYSADDSTLQQKPTS